VTEVPGHQAQPAQVFPGWRLWVSSTGRHWALRCAVLTAAQIAAGARPLLWAEDGTGLVALISVQDGLIGCLQSACCPGQGGAPDLGQMPGQN
jgi:hypothetical protein